MGHVIVLDRQTLFDVALQSCGSVEAAFDIADINDVGVTAFLQNGAVVEVPNVANKKVVDYYKVNDIKPATEVLMSGDGQYAVLRTVAGEDIIVRTIDGSVVPVVPITPPTKTIADFDTVTASGADYIVGYDPHNQKEIKFPLNNISNEQLHWETI